MTDVECGMKGSAGGAGGTHAVTVQLNPCQGFVSTWQGIVEIVLRGVTLFLVFLVFLTAAVAFGQIDELDPDVEEFIDESDEHHDEFDEVPDTPNLAWLSRVDGGFLIALAFLVTIYEVLAIVLRFLNLSLVNNYIKVFLIVDIAVSGALALTFLIAGAISGAYSVGWDEWVDFGKDLEDGHFHSYVPDDIVDADLGDAIDTSEHIRGALRATAFFCLFEVLAFLVLAGWALICILVKWALPQQTQK